MDRGQDCQSRIDEGVRGGTHARPQRSRRHSPQPAAPATPRRRPRRARGRPPPRRPPLACRPAIPRCVPSRYPARTPGRASRPYGLPHLPMREFKASVTPMMASTSTVAGKNRATESSGWGEPGPPVRRVVSLRALQRLRSGRLLRLPDRGPPRTSFGLLDESVPRDQHCDAHTNREEGSACPPQPEQTSHRHASDGDPCDAHDQHVLGRVGQVLEPAHLYSVAMPDRDRVAGGNPASLQSKGGWVCTDRGDRAV